MNIEHRTGHSFLMFAGILFLGCLAIASQAVAATPTPPTSYPVVPSYLDGANSGNPSGTLTSCESVRKMATGGKGISGGTAGLDAGGTVCFDGRFCATMESYTYTCAGANILEGTDVDIDWRAFDISEEEEEETQNAYYEITTRDETRGRSGHDIPLFMNAHGICRKVDNTTKHERALFMGVKSAEEWRTVHGVPEGGDPNAGYSIYANEDGPDGKIQVAMSVCCSPVILEICGSQVQTGYAAVGETVSAWGANGGHATVQCIANNDWRVVSVDGICGDTPSGGGNNTGGSGVYNPNTGGEMSQQEWDNLSGGVQNALKEQGYRDIKDTTPRPGDKNIKPPPENVEAINRQAKEDIKAAEAAAKAEAERIKAENERRLEEERRKAEEERRRQEEEAANDDDDNT